MRRRDFITLLGGAGVSWPLAGQAQQMPVIGFLDSGSFAANTRKVDAFRRGLAEAGYVENSNVVIEFRWADAQFSQLRPMADNLVRRQVAVIVAAAAGSSALAAKAATSTIPIVIAAAGDPVGSGLVASLARPGGNVTGLSMLAPELVGKRLELLAQAVPGVNRVAVLW